MAPPSPLCYLSVDKAVTRQPPKLCIWLLASLWWLAHFVCCFILEMGAQGTAQNSLELTNLCLTLLSAEVTSVCHHAWLEIFILCLFFLFYYNGVYLQVRVLSSHVWTIHYSHIKVVRLSPHTWRHCVRNVHKSSPLPVSNYTGSYHLPATAIDCPNLFPLPIISLW